MAKPKRNLKSEFLIRSYRDGDEAGILKALSEISPVALSVEHWHWKYRSRSGPRSGMDPILSVATTGAGDILGQYSILPVQIQIAGTPYLAGQCVDLFLKSEAQGRGLFEAAAERTDKDAEREGLHALFCFPNSSWMPGFVRKLGWTRLGFLTRYSRRLHAPRGFRWMGFWFRLSRRLQLAAERVWRTSHTRYELTVTGAVPETYESFWNATASGEILSVWKDAAYFRWRYDLNPTTEFEYFSLSDPSAADQMVAIAVVCTLDKEARIFDFLVLDRRVDVGRVLVQRLEAEMVRRGVERLSFRGRDVGFFREVFHRFAASIDFTTPVCVKSLDPKGEIAALLPQVENWTLTEGDGDFS